MATEIPVDRVKDAMREVWALGDYRQVAARLRPVAETLCRAADVGPGLDALDVATGTGNVALAAARRGARTSAVDLTPRMLVLAAAEAAKEGVDVRWVHGDAEDLPFPDGSFDRVLSACGLWFAPRPHVAVAEARRVLRPHGLLGLANYTPGGYWGRVNALVTRFLPLPEAQPEPNLWGVPEVVRRRLGAGFAVRSCDRHTVGWSYPCAAAATRAMAEHSPPHVAAARRLGARAPELFAAIEEMTAAEADETGVVRIEAEYLVVVAERSRS